MLGPLLGAAASFHGPELGSELGRPQEWRLLGYGGGCHAALADGAEDVKHELFDEHDLTGLWIVFGRVV